MNINTSTNSLLSQSSQNQAISSATFGLSVQQKNDNDDDKKTNDVFIQCLEGSPLNIHLNIIPSMATTKQYSVLNFIPSSMQNGPIQEHVATNSVSILCGTDLTTNLHVQTIPQKPSTVFDFMQNLQNKTKSAQRLYTEALFGTDEIRINRLQLALKEYKRLIPRLKGLKLRNHFGFAEKLDLESGSILFVRADLHGDVQSLRENFLFLRQEGLLDGAFKAQKLFHLLFLGDFADRGANSIECLEQLANLKMENPNNVHLIAGNHEDLDQNFYEVWQRFEMIQEGKSDGVSLAALECDYGFTEYLAPEFHLDTKADLKLLPPLKVLQMMKKRCRDLKAFYSRLPLALFISEPAQDKREPKEYMMFSHALLEPAMDLVELLDDDNKKTVTIPKERSISARIQLLIKEAAEGPVTSQGQKGDETITYKQEQLVGAQKISSLVATTLDKQCYCPLTWGKISEDEEESSFTGKAPSITLGAQTILEILAAQSGKNRVRGLIRGHEHVFEKIMTKNKKVVAYTLGAAPDSDAFREIVDEDTFFLIKTAPRMQDWKFRMGSRARGNPKTVVSDWRPLFAQSHTACPMPLILSTVSDEKLQYLPRQDNNGNPKSLNPLTDEVIEALDSLSLNLTLQVS